mmetsp:Transcript_15170/g.24162  ORF Transcript_15170/g.24162 Transcript_15170/m.24162 type:complete len:419 (-) Transcript_15170:1126-2382(-)
MRVGILDQEKRTMKYERLSSRVVFIITFFEIDKKVEVLPHIMIISYMIQKPVSFLTQLIKHKSLNPAHKTAPRNHIINELFSFAQLGKCIDDNPEDNVHENRRDHDVKQKRVDHAVENEIPVGHLHVFDLPWNLLQGLAQISFPQPHVKHNECALPNRRTAGAVIIRIKLPAAHDIRPLQPEFFGKHQKSHNTEKVVHDNQQNCCLYQRLPAVRNRLDHISQNRRVAENLHEMHEQKERRARRVKSERKQVCQQHDSNHPKIDVGHEIDRAHQVNFARFESIEPPPLHLCDAAVAEGGIGLLRRQSNDGCPETVRGWFVAVLTYFARHQRDATFDHVPPLAGDGKKALEKRETQNNFLASGLDLVGDQILVVTTDKRAIALVRIEYEDEHIDDTRVEEKHFFPKFARQPEYVEQRPHR